MSPADPSDGGCGDRTDVAEGVVRLLVTAGRTVAVAESVTGGSVTDAIAAVAGASACLRGGVVAYATDLKVTLLGVPESLLAADGPVHPDVARAMADGVRTRLGADYGVATTGVAGPAPQGGHPPGTFHVAVVGPSGSVVRSAAIGDAGGRAGVRAAARDAAVALLGERVKTDLEGTPRPSSALAGP